MIITLKISGLLLALFCLAILTLIYGPIVPVLLVIAGLVCGICHYATRAKRQSYFPALGIAVAFGLMAGYSPAMAAKLHPRCNIDWPCAGTDAWVRTGHVSSRITRADRFRNVEFGSPMYPPETQRSFLQRGASILPHPPGCPRRAFCGCGAAVEVFGRPIRSLWLAANWLRFPRVPRGMEAPGHAAAKPGHVFVIKQVLGNGQVLAYDANSGGRKTRLHVRSLAGFAVVNPHG